MVTNQVQALNMDEKKAFVERIDKKARDENVSIKHAAQRLGCKVWAYYNYKSDIKRSMVAEDERNRQADEGKQVPQLRENVTISLSVSPEVMCYLEKQAEFYGFNEDSGAGVVAQLLLHDCVRGKMKQAAPVNQ